MDEKLDEILHTVAATCQWPSKEEQAKSGHYGMVCETGIIGVQGVELIRGVE